MLTALLIAAQAWSPPTATKQSTQTIVELAVATPELSTLVAALKAADLVDTLSGPGPFTVFAPTNAAFAALPAGVLTNLLKPENKAQLVQLLTYHVLPGAVATLSNQQMIKTLEGQDVEARIFWQVGNPVPDIFINRAKVEAEITASNGVVYIVDAVLTPPGGFTPLPAPSKSIVELAVAKSIVELAVATPELSTLVAALKAADLVDTLSGAGPFTVFAPTNAAFAALPAGVLTNLLKPENKAQLVKLLTYHVLAGAVAAKDLSNNEKIKTLEGQDVEVRLNGTDIMIDNAEVDAVVTASNGIVYIIDAVLDFPTECKNTGYAQCGGKGFSGPTCCPSGFTCEVANQYYSQCKLT